MIGGYRHIHIVGIGGSGMSALAKLLLGLGHEISGTDLRGGVTLDDLADLGVEVAAGHHPHMTERADLVVASSAVPDHDEELAAARARGTPVWRRPQLLESLTNAIPTVGATGTHGKTTTTALLVAALRSAGVDPSFVLGAEIAGMGSSGHHGADDLLVLEADEAFRTFESLRLRGLILTNVEAEHLEHFDGDYGVLLDSFTDVALAVEGPVWLCADDPGTSEVANRTALPTYGFSPRADWHIADMRREGRRTRFAIDSPGMSIEVTLGPPGRHIVANATGALALATSLGYDVEALAAGISGFKGVARRWEHRGTVNGVVLYDDYAHHPTEVEVSLTAAREEAPERLWAVFQPHLYSRTERFADEFGRALSTADQVVVTDVFGAREEPVPGVTGELVAEAARRAGAEVHYVAHRSELAAYLAQRVRAGDLVLSMGAGDITLLHKELASLLAASS